MVEEKFVCPKCFKDTKHKNGFKEGVQRYKCRNCGCNFTKSMTGYGASKVRDAYMLYLLGYDCRKIEKIIGVDHVTVYRWVNKPNLVEITEKLKYYSRNSCIQPEQFVKHIKILEKDLPESVFVLLNIEFTKSAKDELRNIHPGPWILTRDKN